MERCRMMGWELTYIGGARRLIYDSLIDGAPFFCSTFLEVENAYLALKKIFLMKTVLAAEMVIFGELSTMTAPSNQIPARDVAFHAELVARHRQPCCCCRLEAKGLSLRTSRNRCQIGGNPPGH